MKFSAGRQIIMFPHRKRSFMLAFAIVFNSGIQMGYAGGSAATAGPVTPLKLSETFVGFDKKKFTKDTMFWLGDGVAEKTLLKGLYRTEKASFGT